MATTMSPEGFLVAGATFSPGNVVVECPALVAGPGRARTPVCLACLATGGSGGLVGCSKGGWPVCGAECEKEFEQTKECSLLSSAGLACTIKDFSLATEELDFLTPLRLILAMEASKEVKEKVSKLKVDVEQTKKRNKQVYGESSDTKVIEVIAKKLKVVTDAAAVEAAVAVVEIYSMVVDASKGTVGVYPDLASITHSCSPNTYHTIWSSMHLVVRAAAPLHPGEPVAICRVDTSRCNLFRRRLLKEALVECQCSRCSDGSERGTGFGSIACKGCPGNLSSTNSMAETADWQCSGCGKTSPGTTCIAVLDKLRKELESIEHPNDLEKVGGKLGEVSFYWSFYQILLRGGEWSGVPANSQLFYEVRHRLIYLYQYHKDFYFSEENYLKLKLGHIEACWELMKALFPGWSFPWVFLMFEKMSASVALMLWMKMNGKPVADTNAFIGEIVKIPTEPVAMAVQEEAPDLVNQWRQTNQIAVEAREESKTRVLINPCWQDEDDDDYWAGYT